MSVVIEDFYGCYLLISENVQYKNRTYIGFTVDPNRRINQHNKGVKSGGAKKTNDKGPWSMVLIVYGFPNEISALRFEWAWQHPQRSSRLHHIPKKSSKETKFAYEIKILNEMLKTGPWNRLPLTIRWLRPEFAVDCKVKLSPPIHMPITEGDVVSKKPKPPQDNTPTGWCHICKRIIENISDQLKCFVPGCDLVAHVICLAESTRNKEYLIPVEVCCPKCKTNVLWGDLVRHRRGCYQDLNLDL